MINLAKHQIKRGLRDAKFLFMATLVLLSFIVNAVVYSERYHGGRTDYEEALEVINNGLEENKDSLQHIANYAQRIVKPRSPLTFIADGGELQLPNSWSVNAFRYTQPEIMTRRNEKLPVLIAVDWAFIIGTLMLLLTVLISFGAICGEKRDGTLRLLLSYPVSRMQLFLGKYLGLLVVLVITLLVGVSLNITLLVFNNALPLTVEIAESIGWVLLISILCLSFVLLVGLAVSAMVKVPAISLVILIVGWILAVVAVPGLARMVAEQSMSIRPNYDIEKEIETRAKSILDDMPPDTMKWDGNPFAEWVKSRALYAQRRLEVRQRLEDEGINERIRQARLINMLSYLSPSGLLTYAFQDICDTGIAGFENSMDLARNYMQQLHSYTVARDRLDPETPHLVYSWGRGPDGSDRGVFSQRPVDLNTFPRSQALWSQSGLSPEGEFPWFQKILFFIGNLQVAIIAFIALARYDPR